MNKSKSSSDNFGSWLCVVAVTTFVFLAIGSRAFAADLTLRAGFALTTNPYVEAVTILGRVRATPTSAPVGGLFISFGSYMTCTLRNPTTFNTTIDSLGKIATISGTASCSNSLSSPPFTATTTLVVRFNSNGSYRNGSISLVAVENGETAAFDLVRAKPQIVFVP